jgi:glycosyltransferase involved in cell wall biosynthesis
MSGRKTLDLEDPNAKLSHSLRPGGERGRPLRVALVTSSYAYIQDGVALTLNRLVAFLEAQGVEVLVFTPTAEKPTFAYPGEVVSIASIPLPLRPEYRLPLGLTKSARARLEAFKPDILHVTAPDFLGHQAVALGEKLGLPIVASYHTRYETYLTHYGFGLIADLIGRRINAFYRRCREVYVPSESMAEALAANGDPGKVRLWTRGVDTARFDPARRSAAWRREHGIGGDEVVLLFASRLVREKRLATLADMFSRLEAAGVRCRAVIVGDGPERESLAKALPDALFLGFLTGDALPDAYANADLFVFPSDTETFGSVTLEAMASGLPTLCADATGSRSLVDPGVTGFLEPADSGEAFYRRARQLIEDPDRRRAMSLTARERSLRFSWDEAMATLLDRYRTVVRDALD